ncbi:MAG: hypothetical protein A2900_06015 [Candidatus Chisholmbacteria bacterium RIFCSPLOWO2_01_FULL_50_28]|uniref:Glycosyltransferase 2-like domain-containing protein n=1 Tax=Candidatus Chisholmbacteria bacterium RIFCSPHIGHO2_01_FULL_52_32 TaxID=1797591 RepID=A0A1G1VQN4_9BACT|nr:MAG: hypothetical protein A2786_05790 [Candidatus Chisholmbacteria bacterium RIFCSPHIGHO2_01_FULL_52_32]OGY20593.1 MAG: hypothetical protein A2900_06015 [Candidatus Chisholmbacteria bacterium RIFCSPLOWO2_01_FULL_50_28]
MVLPLVSAIITTYNNKRWLGRSVASILRQSGVSVEVIVVDNASLDQAARYVREHFPDVRVVELPVNRGFGAGNNAGAKVARGKYLFIGNDDSVLDRNCIEEMAAVMEKDASIGVCQGRISSYDYPRTIQSTGLFFNYSGVLVGDRKRDDADLSRPNEIFAAGGPFLVRRDVFEKVGGFDKDFFLYFEEVDLCWRVWLWGFRVVYAPRAMLYHKGGATTRQLSEAFILTHSVRNRLHSYLKNMGFPRILIALMVQAGVLSAAGSVFLFRGKPLQSLAILKAVGWNIWHLPKEIAKRFGIQRMRRISDRELFRRVGAALPLERLLAISGFRRTG